MDKVANILVLDNETDSRTLLKRFLELSGYRVTACSEFAQVPAEGGIEPFDLAIVNITTGRSNLPRSMGTLREGNKKLKVITIMDHKAEKPSDGFLGDDFLFKPVELDAIELKVKELLVREAQSRWQE